MDLATLVALASFLVAAWALWLSLQARAKAEQVDRREMFLRVHERLVSPELQRGRRHLYGVFDREGARLEDLTSVERDEANQALAVFDIAGLYCSEGFIATDDLLRLWAPSVVRLRHAADPLLRERERHHPGIETWPEFQKLAARAEDLLRAKGVDVDRMILPEWRRAALDPAGTAGTATP